MDVRDLEAGSHTVYILDTSYQEGEDYSDEAVLKGNGSIIHSSLISLPFPS